MNDGRELQRGTALVQNPADPHAWYLGLQDGRVLGFSDDPDSGTARIVLDLRDRVDRQYSENGLVSLALHPRFSANGYMFAVYRTPGKTQGRYYSRLSRFSLAEDGTFDLASEEVFLEISQSAPSHAGNDAAFGLDGYLYYANGDDQKTDVNAQNPGTLLGKILRIDVDQPDRERGLPYSIPRDNPFIEKGAPEVFAIGFRNPWRLTVDAETGELFAGDVGQDRREEINRVLAGGNYGWPLREGSLCFRSEGCDDPGLIPPAREFSHSEIRAVVAGFRYRRDDIPALRGRFVYADYVTGRLWSSGLDSPDASVRLEFEAQFNISSMAQAADGTVYVVRYDASGSDGGVYRIAPGAPSEPSGFPQWLSETGCFDPSDARQTVGAAMPFAPLAELWSDGAAKERFLAIPDGTSIAVGSDGDFDLPVGSVLIKHFRFGARYHETRLLMRTEDGWRGYSYEWNEQQTDARLLDGALTTVLPNGVRWRYPSRSECMQCHTSAAGHSLGLEVAQLDSTFDHAEEQAPVNQLAWLLERAVFDPDIESVAELIADHVPLVDPHGDAPLEARARAYLHANCSMCHRPEAPGQGEIDLRFLASLAEMNACDRAPRVSRIWDLGNWSEQRLIAPGRPDDSTLYLRLVLLGFFRMPPLASEVVDERGAELTRAWIESLQDCSVEQP